MGPYLYFITILFVLLLIPAALGISEKFQTFVFVPRWQQAGCTKEPDWTGPTGYPLEGGVPWTYVGYVEPFTQVPLGGASLNADPINDGTQFDKNVSLLTMTAGSSDNKPKDDGDDLVNYKPGQGSPLSTKYQLLADELKPLESGISCVNSRSCYAVDFERLPQKTGNFRQFTNNYKHGYPDSCSAPFQELTLSFYESPGMRVEIPKNCM